MPVDFIQRNKLRFSLKEDSFQIYFTESEKHIEKNIKSSIQGTENPGEKMKGIRGNRSMKFSCTEIIGH